MSDHVDGTCIDCGKVVLLPEHLARAEAAEKERDEARQERDNEAAAWADENHLREAAEAERDRLVAERQRLTDENDKGVRALWDEKNRFMEALEVEMAEKKALIAERERLRDEIDADCVRIVAAEARVTELEAAQSERGESWRPDWTSPPGDTLRELIEMRGWTQALLAREIGWSLKHVNRVVQGHETISVDFALALEALDFATAEFWMRREGDYRVGIARAALAKEDTDD